MKDRIRKVQDYIKMSQQDFASCLGISAASLSGIYTGRTQPTTKHVRAIHEAFPEVNVNWLLFGDGEMLIHSGTQEESEAHASKVASTSLPSSTADPSETKVAEAANASPVSVPADGSLFPQEDDLGQTFPNSSRRQHQGQRREQGGGSRLSQAYLNMGKNIDTAQRKVKEIRVFFDDGTYESFVPSSK